MFAEINGNKVVTWPYDYDTLIKQNPDTSFPSGIDFIAMHQGSVAGKAGNALVRVSVKPEPAYNHATHILVPADTPELEGEEWVLGWKMVALTAEQAATASSQKAQQVRAGRNQMLRESDWTQVADAPVDITAWAAYRQALRDVPAQPGFPWEVTWPQQPE